MITSIRTAVLPAILWITLLPAAEPHQRFQHPVLFGTPVGYFKDLADTKEVSQWLMNYCWLTINKSTTREQLARAVAAAHQAGMDVMVWSRIGADAFCERFAGIPVDVYYYDEPGFPGRWLGKGYHNGGYRGYAEKDKQAFSEYLREKYDETTRRERFGLEDGMVKELPRDGLREELREGVSPNPRLWYEFLVWHNDFVRNRLCHISSRVKESFPGIATYPCLSPCYLEAGPRYAGCDYTLLAREDTFERMQVDPYVHIRMNREYWVSYIISMMRTACAGKPLDAWTCTWHGYGTKPIDMFQGPMCAFAQGVQGYCIWAYYHATQAKWRPDYKERWFHIRRAFRFIQQHADVVKLRPRNKVALYFPHQCYYVKYFDAPWTKHGGVWGAGYFAERTYYSLVRAHVPTDVLIPILGDESAIRGDLDQYSILILPEASYLSDAETAILRDWVQRGGALIATGPLATHDQYGLPREAPALSDVTGVTYTDPKPRRFLKITEPAGYLPSFKAGEKIMCTGWPIKQFLSIDGAKATYEGTGTREQNLKTFRYAVDRLKQRKVSACGLEPKEAKVIGVWDDGTPAVAAHPFGKGRAMSCAAVDATIGYELSPWHDPRRVRFVGDLCRASADLPETDLPEGVEVNVLWGEGQAAVTLFNHGLAPVKPSRLSIALPSAPTAARFHALDTEGDLASEHRNGRVTLRLPGFLDFMLCKLKLQEEKP